MGTKLSSVNYLMVDFIQQLEIVGFNWKCSLLPIHVLRK